ncbi:MAG: hypothetical protein R3E66_21385 [bacterium]
MQNAERRTFLKQLATVTGGVVLMPYVISCGTTPPVVDETATETKIDAVEKDASKMVDAAAVPVTKPENWDAITYNTARGNLGFIPDTYLPDVNGPDGPMKHVGKHLPYIPTVDPAMVPAGFVAIMWGDPAVGHAKHPNAPKSESNPEGHWYNWIKVRKAVDGEAEEMQSVYTDWPGIGESDNGAYAVFGGGDITADSGKNTIYLAALPSDVKPGDTVRIWSHCLTHGEYVDFITV